MNNKAFSLLELLVVISIIGILAALATPVFTIYKARVKMADGYVLLNKLIAQLEQNYDTKGSFPATLTFFDGTALAQTWTTVNYTQGNMYRVVYLVSPDGQGALVQSIMYDLKGVPGFIFNSTACNLGIALRRVNDSWVTKCGMYSPSDVPAVPLQYQPTNCTCNNLASYYNNGTGC